MAVTLYGKTELPLSPNEVILQSIASMPTGGGYSTSTLAMKRIPKAVMIGDGHLIIKPSVARPSFCSEATYLLFLKAITSLEEQDQWTLPPEVLTALLPKGEVDGQGVWGRWNANGPGVARLFYELDLGPNFTNIEAAQPGDFLKIFWSDAIGAKEYGHLVVFLGQEKYHDIDCVTFWSSNSPGGYGKRTCRRSSIHRMVFSRLTKPQNLLKATTLPKKDSYLANLLYRASSPETMNRECGITKMPSSK